MQKEYQLAVDIEKKILTPSFEVNTLDLKTIKLKITITKGMTLVDLTDITVRMSIRKPDGNVIFQDCQVTNAKGGQVEIVLENQAYVLPGSYSAEIMCFKGADKVAVTGSFTYRSIRGIMDDKAVESKSEFTAITGMIKDTHETIEDLRKNGTGIDAQARQEVERVSSWLVETSYSILHPPAPMIPVVVGSPDDQSGKINTLLRNAPSGAVIELPVGEITIKNTLVFTKPVTFRGRGTTRNYGSTVLKAYLPSDSYRKWAVSLEQGTEDDSEAIVRNVRLENFKLINANYTENKITPEHDGINTSLAPAVDFEMNNVFIYNFKIGLDVTRAYLSRFTGCRALGNTSHGFYTFGGNTSLVFKVCYAEANGGDGFHLEGTVYSSLDTCASDANSYGYYLARNRGLSLTSCGSEMSKKCVVYLVHNRGVIINGLFSVEGSTDGEWWTSTFVHVDSYNENVSINNCIEETISKNSLAKTNSIEVSPKTKNIEVNNPKVFKNIRRHSNVKVNGVRVGDAILEGSRYTIGERVENPTRSNTNTGWVCTRSGHYATTPVEREKAYELGDLVNVGGTVYECVIRGTTGTNDFLTLLPNEHGTIIDGEAHWKSLGNVATFETISDYINRLAQGFIQTPLTVINNWTGNFTLYTVQKRHAEVVGNLNAVNVGSVTRIGVIPVGSRPVGFIAFRARNATKNNFVDGYINTAGDVYIDATNVIANDSISFCVSYILIN